MHTIVILQKTLCFSIGLLMIKKNLKPFHTRKTFRKTFEQLHSGNYNETSIDDKFRM